MALAHIQQIVSLIYLYYSSDKLYWEADFQPLAIFINMIHKN